MPGASRIAFWIAVVMAVICLLLVFVSPVFGVLLLAIYCAVAWGIRRGQQLAAITGAWLQIVPLAFILLRSRGGIAMPIVAGVVSLIQAYFFFRAARVMPGNKGWPWVLVMAAWLAFWMCLQPFANPTGSMEDTLVIGDQFLVETVSPRLSRLPEREDLIAFHYPVDRTQTFVKRVVGIPGDRLRILNKHLQRNGAPVDEPYARFKTDYIEDYRDNFPSAPNNPLYAQGTEMLEKNVRDGELVVPDGKYFVLGDNRDSSLDSRYWGFVSPDEIIGRPVLIYNSNPPDAPFILNTRWSRLLKRP